MIGRWGLGFVRALFIGILFCAGSVSSAGVVSPVDAGPPLDTELEPDPASPDSIASVFRDMVVVQRKAKLKSGRALFYSYASFDFSDGPTTMYGLNLDFGYAVSDSFEMYVNVVPVFVANERQIVGQVSGLTLEGGKRGRIIYSRPSFQYGAEFIWAPAYGKDSWGPRRIVRSDTFFKLALGAVQFEADSGLRAGLSIGKTFFLSRWANLRTSAGASYLQAPVNGSKIWYLAGVFEAGLIWYL